MKMDDEEYTCHSDRIRQLANDFGKYHTNEFFAQKMQDEGRYVSHAHCQSVLGRMDERTWQDKPQLEKAAKRLFELCNGDEQLAKRLIKSVRASRKIRS
jgi:hypothetical protein